jgi:hypothetical protein
MNTCSIEVGLLRKKPCGHTAVASCTNCDQPLCIEHAVAQLNEGGHKTGKFMCGECVEAAKEHAKSMVGVHKAQEAKKLAALEKETRDRIANPPAAMKKPPANTPTTQAPAQAAPAEAPKESGPLEFTPSVKIGETKKEG